MISKQEISALVFQGIFLTFKWNIATESENLLTCICGFQVTKDVVIINLNTKGFGIISRKKEKEEIKTKCKSRDTVCNSFG